MPAISHSTPGSHTSIYPSLPISPPPPVPAIPGAYIHQPTPPKFVFGFNNGTGVTQDEWDRVGIQVLSDMRAKMKETLGDKGNNFGEELLKGKKAEIRKLVSVNEGIGLGLGLGVNAVKKDRFEEAHQKEFAK